jgi:hypothetical protein
MAISSVFLCSLERTIILSTKPGLVSNSSLNSTMQKGDSLSHHKCRQMHEVLNVDEIKNYLHSFVVLCETNILSLINQFLDNFLH